MAKQCKNCHRWYPDQDPACPHCHATASQGSSDSDIFGSLSGKHRPTAEPASGDVVEVVPVDEPGQTPEPAHAEPVGGDVLEVSPEDLLPADEDSSASSIFGTVRPLAPGEPAPVSPSDLLLVDEPAAGPAPAGPAAGEPTRPPRPAEPAAPAVASNDQLAEEEALRHAGGPPPLAAETGSFPDMQLESGAPPAEAPPTGGYRATPSSSDFFLGPESGSSSGEIILGPETAGPIDVEPEVVEVGPSSDVLGAGDVVELSQPTSGSGAPPSAVEVTVGDLYEPTPPPGVRQETVSALPPSDSDLQVEESSSAVDLGAPGGPGATSGVDVIAEALESGVDLADRSVSGSGSDVLPASAVEVSSGSGVLPGSGVDVGPASDVAPVSGSGLGMGPVSDVGPVSGSDVIGPPGSGVDVGPGSGVDVSPEPSSDSGRSQRVDLGAPVAPIDDSSAVDLGGSAGVPRSAEEEAAEAEAARLLGALSDRREGEPVMDVTEPAEGPAEVAEEVPAAAAAPEEVAEAALEEPVAVPPRGRERPAAVAERRPSGAGRLLAGTALGIGLSAIAAGAVLFFAPDLIPRSFKTPPQQQPAGPPQVAQPAGPVATPLQQALEKLHANEPEQALALLQGLPPSPEVHSARGEALWLQYLKKQNEDKQPPRAGDPAVQEARKELQDGNNTLLLQQIDLATAAGSGASKQDAGQVQKLLADQKALGAKLAEVVTAKNEQAAKLAALEKALADAGLVKAPGQLDPKAVQSLAKEVADAKKVVGAVSKLVGAGPPEAVAKQIEKVLADRKALDARLQEVDAKLKEAKVKDLGPEGVAELAQSREKLKEETAALNQTLQEAYRTLTASEKVPEGTNVREQLVKEAAALAGKARSPLAASLNQVMGSLAGLEEGAAKLVRSALDRAAVEAQLRYYQAREPLIERPEQKLDTWIALFQQPEQKGAQEVRAATRDAQWVLSPDAKASPEARAKALYLEGLIARNQGRFAEARKQLGEAAKLAPKGDWTAQVGGALKEITDARARYLPHAQKLYDAGDMKAALEEVNRGLAAVPNDGRLLALRGLARLELALGQGKVTPQIAKQVRADAEAAKKQPGTATEGSYVLGRLEEELGQFAKAEADYRQALKDSKGNAAEANRYRMALARLLQREPAPAGEVQEAPQGEGAEESEECDGEEVRADSPLATLVLLALVGVQAPAAEDAARAGRLKESIDLAKELIKSDDAKTRGQGHLILGEAYSRQGRRQEGLKEYIKGLELLYPGRSTKELMRLVEALPAARQPEILAHANPVAAETHFSRGLFFYWQGQYDRAETEFKEAISNYAQDARYHYFLGLARLAEGAEPKRSAAVSDLEQGARLEAESRPGSAQVNASLERIQGPLRRYLDNYRHRVSVAAE
jgi:tetratricopeptide (TPR) repeat protein